MLTLKVAVHDGELVKSNNQISTFVTVVAGGLNVLFLQGSNWSWDYKYMMRSLATSPDIQVEGIRILAAAQGQNGEVPDAEFAPGRYNVFVLSDLPADYLTAAQHRLLVEAVRKGAGLIMLGGHSSFGAGGWADTPLTDILPVLIHPGDGQLEPEGGLKFVPNIKGLNSYVLQVGANKTETARIWDAMKPILGTNRFGAVKNGADIIAETPGPNPEPLMLSMDVGRGRTIAYGGDTWVWYRSFGGEPACPSQVLAANRLLALAQGERRGQQGQGDPRPPPDRPRREDRPDGHRPRLRRGLRSRTSATRPRPSARRPIPPSPGRKKSTTRGRKGRARSTPSTRSASPAITRSP